MIKDELREKEPVAYRCLANALKNSKVAHSYLFSGEYSPLKIETAYLLAQSIIEDKNDFACEQCNTCQRIRNNTYYDVIYVDGYSQSIKKNDVDNILEEFSKTSLETKGKKVYILANVNNSSNKVLNMILKFMEEPDNDNTYGIFISDHKEDLLPTVVSRCQEIPFMARDFSYLIAKYLEIGFEYTDAYLLSGILHDFDNSFDLNDPFYLTGKEYVYKTIEELDNKDYLPVMFSNEFYTSFKQRDDLRKCCDYYIDIMLMMIDDAISDKKIDDKDYLEHLKMIKNHHPEELLRIFMDAKNKMTLNAERKLLFDYVAFEIISYI